MQDSVMLALIGVVSTTAVVFSPILLSFLNGRQFAASKREDAEIRKAEKDQEYARLDAVADKAEATAREAAKQAAEAASLLVKSNEAVAETARVTNGKLDVIHQLVNSNMTAAMQDSMGALKAQLVLMHEVIDLKRAAGAVPSPDALTAIAATEAKIVELQAVLTDRERQAKIVADQEATARAAGTPIERGSDG
jgi:hypothetical protein